MKATPNTLPSIQLEAGRKQCQLHLRQCFGVCKGFESKLSYWLNKIAKEPASNMHKRYQATTSICWGCHFSLHFVINWQEYCSSVLVLSRKSGKEISSFYQRRECWEVSLPKVLFNWLTRRLYSLLKEWVKEYKHCWKRASPCTLG